MSASPVEEVGRIHQVLTGDGVRIALHELGRAPGPRILLVPGTFSNSTFWLGTRGTGFARELVKGGFRALSLDPRGHGASQRPAAGQRWTFEDWARWDVPAAIRWAARNGAEGEAPTALWAIGHSAGGASLLTALAADSSLRPLVAGVVIVATPVPWLQGFRWMVSRVARAMARVLGRFPARALDLGPEDELSGVMVQWMTWNIEGHWRGTDGTDYEALLSGLDMPALFIAGQGDRVEAPPRAVRALHDLVGSSDRTFLLCGRETGFSEDFDHAGLVVSRAARAEVWPRIVGWLRTRAFL